MEKGLYYVLTKRFQEVDPVRGIDRSECCYRSYVLVAKSEDESHKKALKDSNKGFAKGWEVCRSERLKPGDRLPTPDQLIIL